MMTMTSDVDNSDDEDEIPPSPIMNVGPQRVVMAYKRMNYKKYALGTIFL